MSNHYIVEKQRCDLCVTEANPWEAVAKEFPESRGDQKTWDEFRNSGKIKDYMARYEEIYQQCTKPCFYFIADCGGDSIAICKEHLKKIIGEIEDCG